MTKKQIWSKIHKLLSNIIVRRDLKEVRLGAIAQQRKLCMSHKYVLARLRFAQRYENWTIND